MLIAWLPVMLEVLLAVLNASVTILAVFTTMLDVLLVVIAVNVTRLVAPVAILEVFNAILEVFDAMFAALMAMFALLFAMLDTIDVLLEMSEAIFAVATVPRLATCDNAKHVGTVVVLELMLLFTTNVGMETDPDTVRFERDRRPVQLTLPLLKVVIAGLKLRTDTPDVALPTRIF